MHTSKATTTNQKWEKHAENFEAERILKSICGQKIAIYRSTFIISLYTDTVYTYIYVFF